MVAEVGLPVIHIRLCFKEQLPLLSCAPRAISYTASSTAALGTSDLQGTGLLQKPKHFLILFFHLDYFLNLFPVQVHKPLP